MHEVALISGVLEIIDQYTHRLDGRKVKTVNLIVGEMTNAVPEALGMAFAALSRGTVAEGAELVIKKVPLTARCTACGWEGKTEKHEFICPQCSALGLDIVTGRELYVESLEVD